MPRDGSGNYTKPFPDVVPDTTIESAVYNGFVNDVAQDLNTPRPVVAGGTGANGAEQALFNLGAESAAYAVTNYSSHVWYPGSFRAAAGATGAPTANAFSGIVHINEPLANPPTNNNVTVEARDLVTGKKYYRIKTAGVWGAWVEEATAADLTAGLALKVAKAGDTMTGALTLPGNAVSALQAVPKQQLDAAVGAIPTSAVRYDVSQGLTAAQQEQARSNIFAAPFDALGYFGMQVNGNVDLDQPAAGTAVTLGSTHAFPDGWRLARNGSYTATGQRVLDAPAGISASFKFAVSVGAAMAAGDYLIVASWMEGYRVARLAWGTASAQPISIGFWVKANRTGMYSGAAKNMTATQAYIFTFTINASNTWEWKTVTIPGATAGVWEKFTQVGLNITFAVACGTTFQAAAGAWTAGNLLAATGTINGAAANTDTFQITGLIVVPGVELPSQARSPYIMRPATDELALCQRYYEKSYDTFTFPNSITTAGAIATRTIIANAYYHTIEWRRTKRVVPTVTTYSTATGLAGMLANINTAADIASAINNIGENSVSVSSGGTAAYGDPVFWHYVADARF